MDFNFNNSFPYQWNTANNFIPNLQGFNNQCMPNQAGFNPLSLQQTHGNPTAQPHPSLALYNNLMYNGGQRYPTPASMFQFGSNGAFVNGNQNPWNFNFTPPSGFNNSVAPVNPVSVSNSTITSNPENTSGITSPPQTNGTVASNAQTNNNNNITQSVISRENNDEITDKIAIKLSTILANKGVIDGPKSGSGSGIQTPKVNTTSPDVAEIGLSPAVDESAINLSFLGESNLHISDDAKRLLETVR